MVRILTSDETQAFLARHTDLTVNTIPSYGVRIYEYGKDYLVGVNHNNGQIYVMDVTTYDPDTNERIDPSIADQSEIHTIYDAVVGGIGETASDVSQGTIDMFNSINDLIAFASRHLYVILFIVLAVWLVTSGNYRKIVQGLK